jgi:hypothetical protein
MEEKGMKGKLNGLKKKLLPAGMGRVSLSAHLQYMDMPRTRKTIITLLLMNMQQEWYRIFISGNLQG